MPEDNATAANADTETAKHVVGIGDLRVVLTQEENDWYAQGLEIDYLAQGPSIEEAKENFETGLAATFHENLRAYGTIQRVLVPAPVEVWKEQFKPGSSAKRYMHVSVDRIPSLGRLAPALPDRFPFQAIEYLQAVP